MHDGPAREPLEHGRLPKPEGVTAAVGEEQTRGQDQDRGMPKGLPYRQLLRGRLRFFLSREAPRDPLTLLRAQPSGVVRPIRKKEKSGESEEYGRNPLKEEEPAPARNAEPVHAQNDSGNRS